MVSAQGVGVFFMEGKLKSIVTEERREMTVWPTSRSETENVYMDYLCWFYSLPALCIE